MHGFLNCVAQAPWIAADMRLPFQTRANWPSIRKLVIIGDGACGKTSLLSVFTLGYFPTVSNSVCRKYASTDTICSTTYVTQLLLLQYDEHN